MAGDVWVGRSPGPRLTGILQPSDPLPSEKALADRYRVAVSTAQVVGSRLAGSSFGNEIRAGEPIIDHLPGN